MMAFWRFSMMVLFYEINTGKYGIVIEAETVSLPFEHRYYRISLGIFVTTKPLPDPPSGFQ